MGMFQYQGPSRDGAIKAPVIVMAAAAKEKSVIPLSIPGAPEECFGVPGLFRPVCRALDFSTGSESGLTDSGMSGCARSLPYDLLGLLERHDALALVASACWLWAS
jgi:hypothetical protein